ncbi:MAG TPA: DUF3857 domain-containing protein [Candidatus Saccharimonadales bacterium]|nr:DUF3857 domain-containing protein [Candidatus Saccharimonadales bacterium]
MSRRTSFRGAGAAGLGRSALGRASLLLLLPALVLLAGAARAGAEPMTFDGREDIGAMLAGARATWNLDQQDAVLLLESARFAWLPDGRLREERHRVVWINSDAGIRAYADLRVPWDSERQTLAVKALRVWRGGRWIQARPTAVVETTPFAFAEAPDYTGIRETMLLHDGVEVPCVLECDYVIEDKTAYRPGMEGQWLFAHADPAWESRVVLEVPEGGGIRVRAPQGAAEAAGAAGGGEAAPAGYVVHTYAMHRVEPAPAPATPAPASYLPRLAWSSFPSREALGAAVLKTFEANLAAGAALRDSVAALRAAALSRADLARRVADFARRSERRIVYDPQLLWARARPASRVYDTGYGADLDLAVVAGALFKEAGFESVRPAFLGPGCAAPADSPATLADYELRGVLVQDGPAQFFYDVARGTLETGAWARGSVAWVPGADPGATRSAGGRSELALELRWDKASERWTAEGVLEAAGLLNPFAVRDLEAAATRDSLEQLAGAVVESLAVTGYNLVDFGPDRVALRLVGAGRAGKRDAVGRIPVVIGDPPGGLRASLPADVHMYLARRGTPVQLPGPLEQTITLKLHLGELEAVRLPEPVDLANAAGRFQLAVRRAGDTVTVTRTTRLAKATYAPGEWPALRALLLAEGDPANRTLLLK